VCILVGRELGKRLNWACMSAIGLQGIWACGDVPVEPWCRLGLGSAPVLLNFPEGRT